MKVNYNGIPGPLQTRLSTFFMFMWVIGLFVLDYARVIPSVSMIGLVLTALVSVNPRSFFINFKNRKSYLALGGLFIIVLPSWFYSDNTRYLGDKLQLMIPFLVLPFAFASLKPISQPNKKVLILTYITGVFLTSLMAFVYYLNHQQEVNQAYLESRVMPTWVGHHPTFSLMIALAIYYAYQLSKKEKNASLKTTLLFVTFFLLIFIHVYSVRGGLLALYGLIALELYHIIVPRRDYKAALISLMVCVTVGFFTYKLSPTIRNKIANTQNDLNNYRSGGSANNQSLGSRMISYKNAIEIAAQSSWLFGCGLGDVEDLSNRIYQEKYPDIEKKIIPHNQFLYLLAATGIIGVAAFIFCFYLPLWRNRNNHFLLAHYVVISAAFMFEAFLTTQLGVAFCLLFILVFVESKQPATDKFIP